MVGLGSLEKRLVSWMQDKHVDGGARQLDNLALRDAARDLKVSYGELRDARDALVLSASDEASNRGKKLASTLSEGRAQNASFEQRDLTRSPLSVRLGNAAGGGEKPASVADLVGADPEGDPSRPPRNKG